MAAYCDRDNRRAALLRLFSRPDFFPFKRLSFVVFWGLLGGILGIL